MKTFSKKDLNSISIHDLNCWLSQNKKQLIGSVIFTRNESIVSKVVSWVESFKCEKKGFIPSHVGSIIEYNNELYIFDMKPLYATVQPLFFYILGTDDDFVLFLRDFEINEDLFCKNIKEHIGEPYPFMSAISSAFRKKPSSWRKHCSEMYLSEVQKFGVYEGVNSEITPDELFHLMLKSNYGDK